MSAKPPDDPSLRLAAVFLLGVAVGICGLMVWQAMRGFGPSWFVDPPPAANTESD